ncbi:MAG TPA: glyceraldehyde-3-phosphate dehydrogenase [Bacteroidia bacterium]|nr:glyceraldehyde-3-phosphate dehydrogenase [Bacteroidia bacterium]HNT79752.1 glyceraldehyde-3-phosphate dehydrogenase [Bacteroidia bacterium]
MSETISLKKSDYESGLSDYIKQEKAALELSNLIGKFWFERSVELIIFRNQLVDRSTSEILSLVQYAKDFVEKPINIFDTLELAQILAQLELAPSRIDIGRVAYEWLNEKDNYKNNKTDFIKDKFSSYVGSDKSNISPKDVVLYGFGRIGRLLMRELISQAGKGEQLRLRAVVLRNIGADDLHKRAELLRNDSVHGPFAGTVIEDTENMALIVNGHTVYMIGSKSPESIDYTAYGINNAILIDNTGVVRDREGLSQHLKAKGIDKVLLTAPGKGDVPNVVYGVNENSSADGEKIFSAASCTTNAIVPVLSVIDKTIGIERGHIETIHAYTNDQNLLDNYHKKYRRGRSAALNMVITETGAAKAVAKVLPHLDGILTGNAVRVPTPDVSLAILNLTVKREVSKENINGLLKEAALKGDLIEQIQFSQSNELVSTDLVGNSCASIVDSAATLVSKDQKSIVLYVWYDNEYGYSRQVIRYTKYLANVIRLRYY